MPRAPLPLPTPPADQVTKLRNLVRQARDLELQKKNAEEALKATAAALNELYQKALPDFMEEVGMQAITLEAEGNAPRVTAKLQPFYSANVAASWPDERRQAAFNWLESNGHGDLIKTEVHVPYNREERAAAVQFAAKLRAQGLPVSLKEGIHAATLTAWLKEQVQSGKPLPPLEVIGATIGRVVKLSEEKQT